MKKVLWTLLIILFLFLGFFAFDTLINNKRFSSDICAMISDQRSREETQTAASIYELDEKVANLQSDIDELKAVNQELIDLLSEEIFESSKDDLPEWPNNNIDTEESPSEVITIIEDTANESDENVISQAELEQMRELLEKLQNNS